MNRLEEILRVKREEIEGLLSQTAGLDRQALARNDFRDFRAALSCGSLAIIGEVKKASPSAGVIAESFDPITIAQKYERDGAAAISILTDEQFFQGRLEYLRAIREAVRVPLLRKDFILDEIQIAQSAAAGADAILLIVAALEQKQLVDLLDAATRYRLDALVEVHTLEELERALAADAKIIGINNRDLATFHVDLAVTEQLCKRVPDDVLLVSESGIRTLHDVDRMKACGVDALLIGKALMRGELSIEELREK
ncbi:MAG: indole-3-glycerol phosphate synthase [Verrucomicrobiota bacterium]|jgi:indole-3-glycerol phosphate synthase